MTEGSNPNHEDTSFLQRKQEERRGMQGREPYHRFWQTATFPLNSSPIQTHLPPCMRACNTNCTATTFTHVYTHKFISIVSISGAHIRAQNCLSACSKSCHEWYWQESQALVAITIITIGTVKPCYNLAALALPAMLWLLLLFSGDAQAFTRRMQGYAAAGLSRAFWS